MHLGSERLLAGISRAGRKRVRLALSLDMVGVGPSFYVFGIEPSPNRSARLALTQARRQGLRPIYRVGGDSDHAEMSRGGLAAAWLTWRWDNCWHRSLRRRLARERPQAGRGRPRHDRGGTRGARELSDALRAIRGMDDAAVIEASLADPHRFGTVFDRHFDAVHGFAERRLGADLADEIAAETFVRAFDLRGKYDRRRGDARPWLLGIAANLLRRHWRTERRRLAAYARAGAERESAPDQVAGLGELAGALDDLTKDERDVLLLYALAELSYEEIAVALKMPIGTVRSRLARARRRLRARHVGQPVPPTEIEEPFHV